jgi:hypothetical protein
MLRILSILMFAGAAMLKAQALAMKTISIEQDLSQGFIADIHQDGEDFFYMQNLPRPIIKSPAGD